MVITSQHNVQDSSWQLSHWAWATTAPLYTRKRSFQHHLFPGNVLWLLQATSSFACLFSSLDCRFIPGRNHIIHLCNSHAELTARNLPLNICLLNELNNIDEKRYLIEVSRELTWPISLVSWLKMTEYTPQSIIITI